MPKKKEWTVRVINFGNDDPTLDKDRLFKNDRLRGLWIEQLRRMGYVTVLKEVTGEQISRLANIEVDYEVLEFYAPKGLDSEAWARSNAASMQSFGINAVAAPKWER